MTELVLAFDRSPNTSDALREDLAVLEKGERNIDMLKLGLQSMTAELGREMEPSSVASLVRQYARKRTPNVKILWDAKLHDIGNTMAEAIRNLTGRVHAVTLHASASTKALRAASEARYQAAREHGELPLVLFAVTLLTDFDDPECISMFRCDTKTKVVEFVRRAIDAGIQGIVCSGEELRILKEKDLAKDITSLVPGGRPRWADHDDQKRVMTPYEIAELGADYAVFGRSVWESRHTPTKALQLIKEEMRTAA